MMLSIGDGTSQEFFSHEMSTLNLNDKRLEKRAESILVTLQKNLTSCVRRMYTDANEARQAYDFFSNPKVKGERLLNAHYDKTVARIHDHKGSKYLLMIQDGMWLNYTKHKAKTDIGRVGKTGKTDQYGLIQHSTLCISDSNEPFGLLDMRTYHYDEFDNSSHHHHRSIESKKTCCWLDALKSAKERIGSCSQTLVTVADREGDFFEFLHELVKEGELFVIRQKHNRCTGKLHRARGEKCWDLLDKTEIIGKTTQVIQDTETREIKEVELNLKAIRITLPPPNKSKEEKCMENYSPIEVNLVQAFNDEYNWLLLTSLPICGVKEVIEVIQLYKMRWHIEEFHKILKTGYQVDEIYLHSTREAIENMLVMAALSACRLYWLIYMGRIEETLKANKLFTELEWKSIYVYLKEKIPNEVPPLKEVIIRIARMGGYKPNKNSAPPGIKTMWIGFSKFSVAATMLENMMSMKT